MGAQKVLPRVTDVSAIRLLKIDPDNKRDMDELYRQRILCGWNEHKLPVWSKAIKAGTKNFFWIMPTDPSVFPIPESEVLDLERHKIGPPPPDPSFQPLGHVALDWEDDGGDSSLASRADKRITIATFFILTSQQSRGLGNLIMRHLEDMARSPEFGATELTLNTLSEKEAMSEEWHVKQGFRFNPDRRINQHWYMRLGYVPYKEEGRYPSKTLDGEDFLTRAVFMRKSLVPQA